MRISKNIDALNRLTTRFREQRKGDQSLRFVRTRSRAHRHSARLDFLRVRILGRMNNVESAHSGIVNVLKILQRRSRTNLRKFGRAIETRSYSRAKAYVRDPLRLATHNE